MKTRKTFFANLLCVLFLSLCSSKNMMAQTCASGVLVISSSTQSYLEERLIQCLDATSVHLKLSPDTQYNLSVLGQLSQVTHLSIEFPHQNEMGIVYDQGMASMNYLDCSFLKYLEGLEYLVIDWNGEVLGIEALLQLKYLVYARLPISSFHPKLFTEKSSVVQYEFGDDQRFVLRKDKRLASIDLKPFGYEEFLTASSIKLSRFAKKAERIRKKAESWPKQFVIESDSSKLIMSQSRGRQVSWKFEFPYSGFVLQGNYNAMANSTRLTTENYIMLRESQIKDGQFISTLKRRRNNNYSELFEKVDKIGFRNGVRNGEFMKIRKGRIVQKMVFENGEVKYQYSYSDTLPSFETRYLIGASLSDYQRVPYYKELYYDHDGLSKVKIWSSRIDDSTAQTLAELPFKKGELHGELRLYNKEGDTTCLAYYQNGLLNGQCLIKNTFNGETIVNQVEFHDNRLTGELRRKNEMYTVYQKYVNDTLELATVRRTSDGSLVEEKKWYPQLKYHETIFWNSNQKIYRVLRNNASGRKIYDKRY